MSSALSADSVADFRENGFYILPGFLSAAECDALIAQSKTLANAKNGEYRPALNPHRENPAFATLMKDPKLVGMVERLVGGKASGLQTQWFFGRPGTKGFSVHQDNFFVEAGAPEAFVSTWLALNDTSIENGTIFVFPGAHKEGLLPVRPLAKVAAAGQDYNANNEECVVPARYRRVDVAVPKGTLVFLDSLAPHGSYDNISSDSWRYVMLNNYIRSGIAFRPGNSAKREEIPLYD
jgi:ectoine hydroxylase-related dioxygenase (phytanoyl-CoA dioxygenase family)